MNCKHNFIFYYYYEISPKEKIEVYCSFENVYGAVMCHSCMEVCKIWIEKIIYNTNHDIGGFAQLFLGMSINKIRVTLQIFMVLLTSVMRKFK